MKNLVLPFLFFLFCFPAIAQSDYSGDFEYKAVYQLTYQPDSTDVSSVTSEEMWLYIGNQQSKFLSRGKALRDSLSDANSMAAMASLKRMTERTRTEFDYIIWKNLPENRISFSVKILRDNVRYEDEINPFEWEVLPETRIIKGYQSQKARTFFRGRHYTAWFTPEIPFSEGPYKFSGLPGLILQLRDQEEHYVFELLQFKKLAENLPFKFSTEDNTLTSREKLLQLKREFEEDPFTALDNANRGSTKQVTIKLSRQQKREHLKRIREKLAKRNNPIELK